MADINGTNGNDLIFFQGEVQHLTVTLVNPYSGSTILFDDDINVNTSSYEGFAGIDTLFMTNFGDAFFSVDNLNHQTIFNIERIIAGDGGDVIVMADDTITLGNMTIEGGAGDDILWGNIGNDTINGFNGNDIIDGGPGNDTINGQNDNDRMNGGAGNDIMDGGAGNDLIYGDGGDDTLNGGAGDDVLDGGAGIDTLNGGAGNDTYIITDTSDIVTEGVSAGIDTVQSSINYALGVNFENLTLTGAGNINGTGNGLVNTINGNTGDNVLDGGIGADTMAGGAGDDTYIVDDAGDIVTEGASAGMDVVRAGVSYTLGANVENLTLTGTANINGTGNELANTINGNAGDNALDGGIGADIMAGDAGDDTYFVDNAADAITEEASAGTDTVKAGISYALGANVENLTLTGASSINGTGNELDNAIIGNTGNNALNGGNGNDILDGSTGIDILYGGDGNDTLAFTADEILPSGNYAYNIGSPYVMGTGELISAKDHNSTYDIFDGGSGFDTISMTSGNDVLFLWDPYSPYSAEGTAIRITGIEQINAGDGNDIADFTHDEFSYGDIIINGEGGNDVLWSSSGQDTLDGGAGNDNLYGGTGNDILYGGAGDDKLIGGPGAESGALQTTVEEHHFNNTVIFPNIQETVSIMDLVPPGTNALGVAAGDLSVDYATTAEVTFVQTVAGYNNTLGYYNIAQDGTIQFAQIAFANVKNYQAGDTATINLPGAPNTDFGFFIISDGAGKNNFSHIDLAHGTLQFVYMEHSAHERAATVYDPWNKINLVYSDGVHTTNLLGNIFHSTLRGGGTNLNSDGDVHVVSGLVQQGDETSLRIGFEDLKHVGDADYNDVVFDIHIEGKETTTLLVNDSDTLYGGDGNDTLNGGVGADVLYGGTGSDRFVFDVLDGTADTIKDFQSGAGGDVLDIKGILEGYDPLTDAIGDFVRLVNDGGNTQLQVNYDGHAGGAFAAIAIIEGGVGSYTLADLVNSGNLAVV